MEDRGGKLPVLLGDRAEDWTECESDGRSYWHNTVTKASVWEMPQIVRNQYATDIARESGMSIEVVAEMLREWGPHRTTDGRFYFHNSKTGESLWQLPGQPSSEGREDSREVVTTVVTTEANVSEVVTTVQEEEVPVSETNEVTDDSNASPMDIDKSLNVEDNVHEVVSSPEKVEYETERDRIDAFKGLLADANIDTDSSWGPEIEQQLSMLRDPRFNALRTSAQRRAVLREYQAQLRKRLEEEARELRRKRKEEFFEMLEEAASDGRIDVATSYRRASSEILVNDSRFTDITDELTRRDLYEDFMHILEKKEREQSRQRREKAETEFRRRMESLLAEGKVDARARSSSVLQLLDGVEGEEGSEGDWKLFRDVLSERDRVSMLDGYLRELRRKEAEKEAERRREERELERERREKFRVWIRDATKAGKIALRTSWKELKESLEAERPIEYVELIEKGSGRGGPQDLFEDVMEEIEDEYGDHKRAMHKAVRAVHGEDAVSSGVSYEEGFVEKWNALLESEGKEKESRLIGRIERVAEWVRVLIWKEMVAQAEERRMSVIRQAEDVLRGIPGLSSDSQLEDWDDVLKNASGWAKLSDAEKQSVFDAHIRKRERGDKEASEDERKHKRPRNMDP